MKFRTAATSIVAIIALLNATAAGARFDTIKKVESLPVDATPLFTTAERYPVNSVYWPCPTNMRGTAPNPATPGMMRVGWDHGFDAGTPPFACQYRINHVQRIALTTNLGPISKHGPTVFVDNAWLSFDKKRVSGANECADYLVTKIGDGAESYGPMTPRTEKQWDMMVPSLSSADCEGSRCKVQMKGQVNAWLKNPDTNLGVVLIGDQERLDANDNVSCMTDYANFRLDVEFRFDVKAGTIATPILKFPIRVTPLIALKATFVREAPPEVIYELRWNILGAGNMDLKRDGVVIVPNTADDGHALDRAPFGTVRYQVCQTGTTNCSNEVTVSR